MENLTETTLEKIVKDGLKQKKPIIKGKQFTVVKECVLNEKRFNVIVFPHKKFALEETCLQNRYIDLDAYFLSVTNTTKRTKDIVDFEDAILYNVAEVKPYAGDNKKLGQIYAGRIIVLNNKILVLCRECIPQFFIVVANELREIPAQYVEDIIRFQRLTAIQKIALQKYFSSENWEQHNGILVNPSTLSIPSELHFKFWQRGRNSRANLGAHIDIGILAKMLTRSQDEKPVVKYINL
ncbi:MAG: hypothetical protein NC218_10225 [Acetobacter sp.]|nr:hypothetical protein [Acetobacter sp.]